MKLSKTQRQTPLYMEVYEHYKNLIIQQKLLPGTKMPSLRKCSRELQLSRTTIESAYLQLAADGYIISKAQSGYYVTEIATQKLPTYQTAVLSKPYYRYNFSSTGVDSESFRFDLWQRYLKSALRQDERLLSYGEPQGEYDFREALCNYIRKHRNVLCTPEDIVIGAGVQSLLHILCPLIREKKTVSFPTSDFIQGSTIFQDYGFDIRYRDKNSDIIYVSPAHMTKWGEIMPTARRLELIQHAKTNNRLIIEDDFENEFVYLQKPTPSLFSLSGGQNVVYIGSFSKLLLPSIRISFMVLPPEFSKKYKEKAACYNQTASKAEQIALCQFIRDGHLASQTRRLRRLYVSKLNTLVNTVQKIFQETAKIQIGAAGTSIAVKFAYPHSSEVLIQKAREKGLCISVLSESTDDITLLLSCSSMPTEDFEPACQLLKNLF